LHALSPPWVEESIDLSTLEHATSPGECSNVGVFFYYAILAAQLHANDTCTMIFFRFRRQISLPRLQSCRETASAGRNVQPIPFRQAATRWFIVACHTSRSRSSEPHRLFRRKKFSKRAAASAAPPHRYKSILIVKITQQSNRVKVLGRRLSKDDELDDGREEGNDGAVGGDEGDDGARGRDGDDDK